MWEFCLIREALFQHWEVLLVDVWRWIESHDRDTDREVNPRSHGLIDDSMASPHFPHLNT